MVLEVITNSLSSVLTQKVIISILIGSVIWGALFSLIFLPTMKMLMRTNLKTALNKQETEYQLCIPCSYKKSKINSIGGVMYLSKTKLMFKPNKMNFGSKELLLNAKETILFRTEQQSVPFLTRLMYKNIPDCLVLTIGDINYRFIVPEITKVLEILEEEGLCKS